MKYQCKHGTSFREFCDECNIEDHPAYVAARLRAVPDALASGIGGAGEPRGWLCEKDGLAKVIVRSKERADEWATHGYAVTPLYATPPARSSFDAGLEAAARECEAAATAWSEGNWVRDRYEFMASRIRALKAAPGTEGK